MSGNQSSLKILLPGENVCGGINIFFVEGACLHSLFYFCCRFRFRWLRNPFEELNPKVQGNDKLKAEASLRTAMEDAHKSIPIVTCHIASAIKGRLEDDDFLHAIEAVEEFPEKNSLNQRPQKRFLFCYFVHTRYIFFRLTTRPSYIYLQTLLYFFHKSS